MSFVYANIYTFETPTATVSCRYSQLMYNEHPT